MTSEPEPAAEQTGDIVPVETLDESQKREVIAIVSVGCPRAVAATYVGCHVQTIAREAVQDSDFSDRLQQAESSHEILQLKNINAAANDVRQWRAAAWALERRYPDRYGARRAKTVTVAQVSQVLAQFSQIVVKEVPDLAQRRRIIKRLDELAKTLHSTNSKKRKRDGK
jgi:hypothetical protein